MRPSTRHAIDMLYHCKWNLPEAAKYAKLSNDEMKRTFNRFCKFKWHT